MSNSFLSATTSRAADAAMIISSPPAATEATDEDDQMRSLVVIGVTGDGKSSTCNTLASSSSFVVSGGFSSETAGVASADYLRVTPEGELHEMRVVDTIGLHDTGIPAAEVMRRLGEFADLVPSGISCFLFVVRFGRFKPEHEAAFDAFIANIGEAALAHTILVFTGCEMSADELAKALEQHAPQSLRRLLPRLAGPPVGIDNLSRPREGREAMHLAVDAAIKRNGGARYTHAALAEAKARHDAQREEERAAFAAAVADWRKGSGPVVIERG